MSPISLKPFMVDLKEVFSLYLEKLDKKQMHVSLQTPEEVSIYTSKEQLFQVLFNLLAYTANGVEEGNISFGYTRLNNSDIEFYISSPRLHKIKNKETNDNFITMLNHTLSLQSPLTRIPLSEFGNSQVLAAEPGTTISWDTQYDKGGKFRFGLKNVVNEKFFTDAQAENKIFSPYNTVLLTEDDEYSMFIICHLLDKLNISYHKATNGKEAVKIFIENPGINLVLMDISMPEMDGFDALSEIRKTNRTIPVVALTAYDFPEIMEMAVTACFDDYLIKPVRKDLLINCLKNHLIPQADLQV